MIHTWKRKMSWEELQDHLQNRNRGGKHADKRTRRQRSRQAKKQAAIKDKDN